MPDREKVIKGLEDIVDFFEVMSVIENRCNELKQEAEDAIALLKEQEAKIEQLNRFVNGFSRDAMPVVRCKDCALSHPWNDEEVQCRNRRISQVYVKPDWYCADGERKD